MSFAPKMMVPTLGDDFAEAIRSWVVTDSNGQARVPDIAASRIPCTKSTGQCVEAKAHAYDGYMSVDLADYDITKWDANSIVFKSDYPCAQEVFTIDRNTKFVSGSGHSINKYQKYCKICGSKND